VADSHTEGRRNVRWVLIAFLVIVALIGIIGIVQYQAWWG
jgi:hypothetical protein